MSFFSKAALADLAAHPETMPAFYRASRAAFKKALGASFASQPEDQIKLAFAALVAYELKPYGTSKVVTLDELLATNGGLDCVKYVLLASYLFEKLSPTSASEVALIGWDGGAVGNHAQLLISTPGSKAMLVDPTIGLFAKTDGYNALVYGDPIAKSDQVSFYSRHDIDWFNGKVVKAVTDGLFKPADILYYYGSPEELLQYPPLTRTYVLPDHAAKLTLPGKGSVDSVGNELANILTGNSGNNSLWGLLGNDKLLGKGGNDILHGGDGNDYLDGGFGYDTMIGGRGNDTYILNSSLDVVHENVGEGIDTIQISSSFELAPNFENLVLTGTGSFSGLGNSASNVITGNSGNNVLDGMNGNDFLYGGAGQDTLYGGPGSDYLDGGNGSDLMIGGTGNDVYVVNSSADIVQELAGEGTDTIQGWISIALTSYTNVENVTLMGRAALNASGTSEANVLIGNDGSNILDGGMGDDLIVGGGGRDVLIGSGGNDRFVYRSLSDSGPSFSTRDIITTFEHGDKIDLSAIDANSSLAGNQAFKFVTHFSGHAGELMAVKTGPEGTATPGYLVYADVNGDKNPDFSIQVYGTSNFDKLFAWDFVL
ncbi:calcium-binding protein [Microvirga puerhi]|uniref:Calcium-binding protein n=1 Tax=Microvirga puerhi TaxID=2876078 RepID=A0ABS7VL92_9HYPH|nr:calcium-binding protein [Microvirga puerhi]MBZ6076295.1 hypothetical protein [Microvirga puerhi]